MRLRRPSLPTVIAFVALFVALDGPVQAQRFIEGKLRKGSVDSRVVENRSLRIKDIKKKHVRKLRKPRNNSVTEAKLRNGSVTPGKLATGAVSGGAIMDNTVTAADLATGSVGSLEVADGGLTGADLADGTLAAQDVARFYGRFTISIPAIAAGQCWSGAPANLAPERAGADISQDLVLATPSATWPEDLAFTVRNDGRTDRFVIAACASEDGSPAFDAGIRYAVIDLP